MSGDDWCIEEELKYIFGSGCQVYMPQGLAILHEKLVKDIEEFFKDDPELRDKVIWIIDARFGAHL